MKDKALIIYHKEDNDGVLSCALIENYIKEHLDVDIERWGVTYNDLNALWDSEQMHEKFDQYQFVYMADVSFNNAHAMLWMQRNLQSRFIWFDHHKPIINTSFDYGFNSIYGIRNTDQSALMCVWEHYYDSTLENVPDILQKLSDWDSWQWLNKNYNQDELEALNIGITNLSELKVDWFLQHIYEFTHKGADSLLHAQAIPYGMNILWYNRKRYDHIIENSGDITWTVNGCKACAVFMQEPTGSYVFRKLKDTDIRHGIVFKHAKNGNWGISLYNINENEPFDCGAYLKTKYGGGGHKGAAGCTFTQDQFIEILKNKAI